MAKNENLFSRLGQLFRSGPVIKRRVRKMDGAGTETADSAFQNFKKTQSYVYSTAMSAYGTYDRMARYSDFQEMEYCLHEDTLIAVPGGYKRLGELAAECEKNPEHTFVVYSYNHNDGQIVPAIGKQARQTRVDHAYTVTFDNGQKIIGTPNHRLMKRDGTFCKIEDLAPGVAMMPFYRRDLFNGCKDEGAGYRWIYTMDRRSKMNGWTPEHRLLAEMIKGEPLADDEVVHHLNFTKHDNRIENLQIMSDSDHKRLHIEIINGKKWSRENTAWIEEFKARHSRFMTDNNPAERRDITFGRILETCESVGFNLYRLCESLDTDPNVVKRHLRRNGYDNFETFAKAYNPDWQNAGWDNRGEKNPRYVKSVTFDSICAKFVKGMNKKSLASALDTTTTVIDRRLRDRGYSNYRQFNQTYDNLKVSSIEYHGVIPLYDLTVDGYKNFATDTVISHNTPEIASALDIYAEETAPYDDKGRVLHIFSENPTIQKILEDLFFDTLNIDFNLTSWTRNLVKYGDFFLFNDVDPKYGVINAYPMPVNEVEREEGFDMKDPLAVRYRWVTQGNQVLENWQVSHFRLLGNDAFLPYGSSVLESARRIWRQLILIEDAMLVYRIVRSPDRRVFYVDVGNIPPEDIPNYMEQVQSSLKKSQVIDKSTGRVDLRYNPMSVDEDYFIPVRGSETGTKIDTLAGGTNAAAVEDVQYIQKKLFSALKIPKAYLGYDEGLGAKATLSQEDIRFSRTINRIQRTVISELNKIAIIHLYSHGFEGEDMLDFELSLTNPSTVAQQQKLELYRTRFEIANSALGISGLIDRNWVRKNVFSMTDDEIAAIEKGKLFDKETDLRVEAVKLSEETESDISTEVGIDFTLPPSGDTSLPAGEAPPGAGPEEPGGGMAAPPENLTAGDRRPGGLISEPIKLSIRDDSSPIKAQSAVDRFKHLEVSKRKGETDDSYNRRRRTRSDLVGQDTDHARLVSHDPKNGSDSITHPFGHPKDLKNPFAGKMTEDEAFIDNFLNEKTVVHDKMTASVRSALKTLEKRIPSNRKGVLISESNTSEDMDD